MANNQPEPMPHWAVTLCKCVGAGFTQLVWLVYTTADTDRSAVLALVVYTFSVVFVGCIIAIAAGELPPVPWYARAGAQTVGHVITVYRGWMMYQAPMLGASSVWLVGIWSLVTFIMVFGGAMLPVLANPVAVPIGRDNPDDNED